MNEASKICKMLEDTISEAFIKALQNISIEIDEEEFLKMLRGYEGREQEIVRCKDCKHRPTKPNFQTSYYGFGIEFPEDSKCPCQCEDGYYSWYPEDDWFCANGEVKQNENNAEG